MEKKITNIHREIKSTLEDEALKRFGVNINALIYPTNFGISIYLKNPGYGTIRISDHGISNVDRIKYEILFEMNTCLSNLDAIMNEIEYVFLPERFELVTKNYFDKNYSKELFKSIEDFNERVNKSGNRTIEKMKDVTTARGKKRIEIEFSYLVKRSRQEKVRKSI